MSKSDLDVLYQTISDTQSNICQAVIVKEGKLIYADTWNQKYMEDLTDMQNHVLPYLQSFCSLEEKGVQERREQKIAEKNESREAVPRVAVEINTAVKDAGKTERKAVAQKKTMPEKEKKPSIHERLEINKRIIQEKQGKDKPERGADLGVRTV